MTCRSHRCGGDRHAWLDLRVLSIEARRLSATLVSQALNVVPLSGRNVPMPRNTSRNTSCSTSSTEKSTNGFNSSRVDSRRVSALLCSTSN